VRSACSFLRLAAHWWAGEFFILFFCHCMHSSPSSPCIRSCVCVGCGLLKVYDVYSSIWGCVVLPLCSSQESPQQEGWCQGKLARPLSSPSFCIVAFLYPWLPFLSCDALYLQNYFYYSINILNKGSRSTFRVIWLCAVAFTLMFSRRSVRTVSVSFPVLHFYFML